MPFASLRDVEAAESVPFSQQVSHSTAYELLCDVAAAQPDAPAISFLTSGVKGAETQDITYAGFLERVHQMAHLFQSDGVTSLDAVSMLLPGHADTFAAMFAAHLTGRANPINFMLEPTHIAALLRAARTRVLLVPDPDLLPGVMDKLPAILSALDTPPRIYRIGGGEADGALPSLDSALRDMPVDPPAFWTPPAPEDVAALFHTGGTTSAPKLAGHTHAGILLHSWALARAWDATPDDVVLNGLPPFHVGGGYVLGLVPLTIGAHVVIATASGMRNPDMLPNLWAHVERFGVTILPMVPTSWGAAMNIPVGGADLSSIRLCHSGGAAMPVEIARTVERTLGSQVVEGWGMTELHGFGTMNPASGECRIGSVGYRLPFMELCVAQVQDGRVTRLCAPDEMGQLLARGVQVFSGYLDPAQNRDIWIAPHPDETPPAWSAGGPWLDTGDLARQDAQGYFWLTGRAKDTIIRGGHNIDPLTIEEALYEHPAVEAVAAVGQPDEYAGELPMAFVQLKTGASATPEALRDFASTRIAERAALPARIVVLPALPITTVGKIFKPELRQIAAQQVVVDRVARVLPDHVDIGVTCRIDKRRGMVVQVAVPPDLAQDNRASLHQALGRFTLEIELVDGPAG